MLTRVLVTHMAGSGGERVDTLRSEGERETEEPHRKLLVAAWETPRPAAHPRRHFVSFENVGRAGTHLGGGRACGPAVSTVRACCV